MVTTNPATRPFEVVIGSRIDIQKGGCIFYGRKFGS